MLRRAWGFLPLSVSGLALTLALGTVVYFFGMKRSDHILLLGGLALGLLGLVNMVMVSLTALWIGYRFRRQKAEGSSSSLRLTSGQPAPGQRRLDRWLPPLVEAKTQIVEPEDFDCFWQREPDGSRQEWLIPGRRCELEENFQLRRRVLVYDVLGFSTLDWESTEPISLTVLPPPLPLPSYSLIRAWFTGDDLPDPRGEAQGDRVDMRQYAPGDPPRLLLWKIYARTGKLMVRVPEAAVSTAPRSCAYLVSGPGDEVVASLARTVVENRLLGDGWRFGADGSPLSVTTAEESLRLIARSGNPDVVSGRGLFRFLEEAAGSGFGNCLLFLPSEEGEWVDRVAADLRRSPISVSLITVGSVSPPPEIPTWYKYLYHRCESPSDPQELFSRLTSSMVSDWFLFDLVAQRLVPLRVKNESLLAGAGLSS